MKVWVARLRLDCRRRLRVRCSRCHFSRHGSRSSSVSTRKASDSLMSVSHILVKSQTFLSNREFSNSTDQK